MAPMSFAHALTVLRMLLMTTMPLFLLLLTDASMPSNGNDNLIDYFRAWPCGVSMRRGRRAGMEDRATCVGDLSTLLRPSLSSSSSSDDDSGNGGDSGPSSVRFLGVFDGHEGQRASQAAADKVPFAFARSLLSRDSSLAHHSGVGGGTSDRSSTVAAVKLAAEEAMRAAVAEVDGEFLAEAETEGLTDGTTAAVGVLWGGLDLLMVAHVGDSKAILCREPEPDERLHSTSQKASAEEEGKLIGLEAVELTDDHSLARADEAARVEAATGRATGGTDGERLNGELAVSRAIGDLEYRDLGLISDPEIAFVDLSPLSGRLHSFLILASDGVFEGISPQEACEAAGAAASPGVFRPFPFASAPPDPIALGGASSRGSTSAGSADGDGGTHEPMKEEAPGGSGEQLFSTRSHWGLQGCTDCERGVRLEPSTVPKRTAAAQQRQSQAKAVKPLVALENKKQQQQLQEEGEEENRAAALAVATEAYNRMSMDNVAVVVQRLTSRAAGSHRGHHHHHQQQQHAGGGAASGSGGNHPLQQVVSSPDHSYVLRSMVALVPRLRLNAEVSHLHWDGQPVPIGVSSACTNSNSCIVLRRDEEAFGAEADQLSTCSSSKGYCSWDGGEEGAAAAAGALTGTTTGLRELPPATSSLIARLASLPMIEDGHQRQRHPRPLLSSAADDGARKKRGVEEDDDGEEEEEEEQGISGGWMHAAYAEYKLRMSFARGAFGEVWRCTRAPAPRDPAENHHQQQQHAGEESKDEEHFVLKRIMVEKGAGVRLSGDRERYFGEKFNRRSASLLSGWPQGEGGVDDGQEEGEEEEDGRGGGGEGMMPLQVGADHLVRFVEAFETRRGQELWLVFRDEGMSLHSLMYETAMEAGKGDEEDDEKVDGRSDEAAEGEEDEEEETNKGGAAELKILQPSRWWWRLRRREDSHRVLLGAVRQVLLALAVVHDANVTHRDVKPENLLASFKGSSSSSSSRGGRGDGTDSDPAAMHIRLIDFGSAVDAHSTARLYGKAGPSELEQTTEYAPPETLFGRFWSGGAGVVRRTWPYDIWSAAVVWLELVLGTPHVFQISTRAQALMSVKLQLQHKSAEERQQIFLLRGMMELCIYPPLPREPSDGGPREEKDSAASSDGVKEEGAPGGSLLQWSCSDVALLELLKNRDPSSTGVGSVLAMRLLRAMLHWNPSQRPSAREALRHAAFVANGDSTAEEQLIGVCSRRLRSQAGWC